MAAGGPIYNRRMSAITRPHGPLYLRRLHHQRFVNLPGGPEFFAYLSGLSEPLRLADFSAHTTALGLPEIGPPLGPVGSFLGAPIRSDCEEAVLHECGEMFCPGTVPMMSEVAPKTQ